MTSPSSLTPPPGEAVQPVVAVGQIWRDVGRPLERYVLVTGVSDEHACILTVYFTGSKTWVAEWGAPTRRALLSRFNGHSGGYAFVGNTP